MADRRGSPPGRSDPRDPGELDPAFDDDFEQSLDPVPPAGRRRRFRLPLAAAAIMVAAIVGGAMAGIIFRLREDETALDPTPSPSPTMITTSSAPSASAIPAVTMAPTGTPVAASTGVATEVPTTAPTPVAAPTASPTPAPTATPRPAATPSPTSTPAIVWTEVAEGPDVYAGIGDSSAVGPDGRLYTLFWNARVPNRGRQLDVSPIMTFDPTDASVELGMPAGSRIGTDAQAVAGTDGLLYVFGWGAETTSVFAYDPATDAFVPDADTEIPVVAWDAALGGDGTIYLLSTPNGATAIHAYDPATQSVSLIAEAAHSGASLITDPEGNLVVLGEDGVWVYDLEDDSWRQLTDELPSGMSRRMAAAGPEGRIVFATITGDLEYFDGVEWELLPVTREIGGVSYLDDHWLLLTVETAPSLGPTTVRYWESTSP